MFFSSTSRLLVDEFDSDAIIYIGFYLSYTSQITPASSLWIAFISSGSNRDGYGTKRSFVIPEYLRMLRWTLAKQVSNMQYVFGQAVRSIDIVWVFFLGHQFHNLLGLDICIHRTNTMISQRPCINPFSPLLLSDL